MEWTDTLERTCILQDLEWLRNPDTLMSSIRRPHPRAPLFSSSARIMNSQCFPVSREFWRYLHKFRDRRKNSSSCWHENWNIPSDRSCRLINGKPEIKIGMCHFERTGWTNWWKRCAGETNNVSTWHVMIGPRQLTMMVDDGGRRIEKSIKRGSIRRKYRVCFARFQYQLSITKCDSCCCWWWCWEIKSSQDGRSAWRSVGQKWHSLERIGG